MTAKRKAKAHALLASQKAARNNEPSLDAENYNLSIGQIIQWYNENTNEKQRLKYALEYFAKLGKKAEVFALNKASDYEVRVIGILSRLIEREQPLSEEHKAKLFADVALLFAKYPYKKEKKVDDK